jgi:hypothetical protein
MESRSSPQPDDPGGPDHATSEKENPSLQFSQALHDALSLDKFKEELERCLKEPSKGDYGRPQAVFITGYLFSLHYCRTGSLTSLDKFIRHREQGP